MIKNDLMWLIYPLIYGTKKEVSLRVFDNNINFIEVNNGLESEKEDNGFTIFRLTTSD